MMILRDPKLNEACSHDETVGLEPVMPLGVCQPRSTFEVQECVLECLRNDWKVTPRGAGTGKAGGSLPTTRAVVIDFSKMNQILEISEENLTARVQPGVILADFKKAVEEKGLFYPPDPNSLPWCTLGGNVGTNAAGPSALKYGSTRDYVLGLEVVMASGEILRLGKQTVKGVAGYDLVSLVCGSEGTLALVTEITLKLLPKPKPLRTILLRFDSNEHALKAVNDILAQGVLPTTLEYMDAHCMEGQAALMLECEEADVLALVSSLAHVANSEVALNEKQHRAIGEQRRLMSGRLKKRYPHKISEDIVVPRGRILDFTQAFQALGKKHGIHTALFGHAGDGNLHAQLLLSEPLPAQKLDRVLGELFNLTIGLNGTISGEHGIGLAKKRFLPLEQSVPVLELQRAIKKVWDPKSILNPDKIFC